MTLEFHFASFKSEDVDDGTHPTRSRHKSFYFSSLSHSVHLQRFVPCPHCIISEKPAVIHTTFPHSDVYIDPIFTCEIHYFLLQECARAVASMHHHLSMISPFVSLRFSYFPSPPLSAKVTLHLLDAHWRLFQLNCECLTCCQTLRAPHRQWSLRPISR